jgi:scyllo-inositol 2-dehydrogenase (NADP+)
VPDERLRVALIGYGLAGEAFHAPLIAATAGLELAGVVTADPDRRARVADRYPQARLLSSPDEIWADPAQVDLVVISSPNRTHVPLALRAVEAGVPVVVEKPLATRVVDAARLKDAAAARGVPVAVFQNRRWDGDFLTLSDLLTHEVLGSVHRFESRFERWRPDVSRAWRESPDPEDAGGVLYDLGSHLVDQALVLFGPVESVYAELRNVRAGARVDDDAFLALVHRSGTVSHLWASLVAAGPAPRLRVLGSAGSFVKFGLDVQERRLRQGMDPGSADWGSEAEEHWGRLYADVESRTVATTPGRYPRFYELVADALLRGGPMPVEIEDAIATLRVIEAAQASSRQHTVIAL